jgi:hypothetical protein
MKRIAAVAAVVLCAGLATPAAQAGEPLPRPARDDARVIVTEGTYTQDEADANRAAYLALEDYVDQQAAGQLVLVQGLTANIDALVGDIGVKNAQIDLMGQQISGLRGQVATQQTTIALRDAKIKHLRKVIRRLRHRG